MRTVRANPSLKRSANGRLNNVEVGASAYDSQAVLKVVLLAHS